MPPRKGQRVKAGQVIGASGTHTESESHPWTRRIPDHPGRTDSPEYKDSRKLMNALAQAAGQPFVFGQGPWQDHHGGGCWLVKDGKPFIVKLPLGLEWSMQFCAEFGKVDLFLRQPAKTLVEAFPETIPFYEQLGYPAGRAQTLLDRPIDDAITLAHWTDSIFNASVPLMAVDHTGVLPAGAGTHHYPDPVQSGGYIKRDDFDLWVTDAKGKPVAAVTPVAPRGSGDGRVQVQYAVPGTPVEKKLRAARKKNVPLILSPRHPIARKAFAKQQ